MADKLEYLLNRQKDLHRSYGEKREWYREADLNQKLVVYTNAIIEEAVEMRRELNIKPRKNKKELNIEHIKEEYIDLVHFILELGNHLSMDAHEICIRYDLKHQENLARQIDGGKDGRKDYISE